MHSEILPNLQQFISPGIHIYSSNEINTHTYKPTYTIVFLYRFTYLGIYIRNTIRCNPLFSSLVPPSDPPMPILEVEFVKHSLMHVYWIIDQVHQSLPISLFTESGARPNKLFGTSAEAPPCCARSPRLCPRRLPALPAVPSAPSNSRDGNFWVVVMVNSWVNEHSRLLIVRLLLISQSGARTAHWLNSWLWLQLKSSRPRPTWSSCSSPSSPPSSSQPSTPAGFS